MKFNRIIEHVTEPLPWANRFFSKNRKADASVIIKELILAARKRRYPIKYARDHNEPLHLTINLTNKYNILWLNFNTKMAASGRPTITYSQTSSP